MNIERKNNCIKCGENFYKGPLALSPTKYTNCTSFKHKVHFASHCKHRRRILHIVDSQVVLNTVCNYPSDQPDINNDLQIEKVVE